MRLALLSSPGSVQMVLHWLHQRAAAADGTIPFAADG